MAATYTRMNAWKQNGTFNNTDLLWYARGVAIMQSRPLNDPNSWWFFAAMHNYYIGMAPSFPDWAHITGPPQVPTTPKPSKAVIDEYWEQCQHQSWYFLPWHRGYLIALEQQIRAAIAPIGGPNNWALPYWNYFGPGDEYKMPPAFSQLTLPDGKPNPLFVKLRNGPKNDGNIYVDLTISNQNAQRKTAFTGTSKLVPGYGGLKTGFWPGGQNPSGNLESNPHNEVHGDIGGSFADGTWGLMSDPGLAGIDPIFYLHHANIDRMWASWNDAKNSNPTDPDWLNGPTSVGDRKFVVPLPAGKTWNYTPKEVNDLSLVDYDYDDLNTGLTPQLVNTRAQRLSKFGFNALEIKKEETMDSTEKEELVGANEGLLRLQTTGARTNVKFESRAWKKVSMSFIDVSVAKVPDRIFIQIENVKGTVDANKLTVSVNQQRVGTAPLFGLRKASTKDGHHAGAGLTFVFDITNIIDDLHLNDALSTESLDVLILPTNPVSEKDEITIGKVSLYRHAQQ